MSSTLYSITEIFFTIQGEGHFVGSPVVFVRLAGCSMKNCHIRAECDTDYKARLSMSAQEIGNRLYFLQHRGIVVITGGEPTDHDLIPLLDELRGRGYHIHVETSGVRAIDPSWVDWLTVSPKTWDYKQRSGHALKIVVRPEWDWRDVRKLDEGTSFMYRYLQPMTNPLTGVPVNMEDVTAMVMSSANVDARWSLSTQTHRYWGLR